MGHVTRLAAACATAALLAIGLPAVNAGAAGVPPRIDLRVLVVDDGGPATAAIAAELDSAGTPRTTVSLSDTARPRIDAAFLSDTVDGRARAKYQAVVLPNDNPFGTGSTEMTAIAAYEKRFGIRQVDAYTYARPEVGLNYAENPGYIGSLDGRTVQVTDAGTAGPFGYLDGTVPFEDNDPKITESYGFLAVPLAQPPGGATFTSYVDAPLAGSTARGSLVGEYAHDGRRELVVTFVYNKHQRQYRLLARGIVEWLTQGIHLGADRNYFGVHVDDVLGADDRWDTELNCTPGDADCGPAGDTPEPDPIRMTADDAQYARTWSQSHGLTLDMAYNAGGSEAYKEENGGTDPLAEQFLADQHSYRWVNHTYNHLFLGCVQNVSVVPWKCSTDLFGRVRWVSGDTITEQIENNLDWAGRQGLAVDRSELVTGEHSGLASRPQQPADNPELAPALEDSDVSWVGSDNSREPGQRAAGAALTVPRYPMNIFYNAGRAAEQVDEYNWIYARKADGGSGTCETAPNTTCLPKALDPATGYASYIVPLEASIGLSHATSNDPRPHFIHQSNLAEDRIAYPVLDRLLNDYRALFADNTPLVNSRMRDAGTELRQRAAWKAGLVSGRVSGYRIGNTVTVTAPSGTDVTATLPPGSQQARGETSVPFGTPYAGLRSGWATADEDETQVVLTLTDAGTPTDPPDPASADRPAAPGRKLQVPDGARQAVPYGPGDSRS
ncbi:hypothetical protein [Streptomyces zagrosensis]|uniref:Uncharacterized protein n=1 Tax=Streptomyces zagrosensis TaxID=1042984 RepID=A0A7W9V0I9_9ACTN|nr:hypothetical protein [Streptomyces zagrosensis]MBB5937907.1 hypothetical protein [Streptomyces zagrosensis]